jgi:hypothetical protein
MNLRPSWSEFSRILKESPRLTNLELCCSGPAKPFTDWLNEPIELPSLETLSLTSFDPIYVSSLFRPLSMPNLTKLSLNLHGSDCSEFIRQLTITPRSVLSRLQYLNIADLACDSSTINAMYDQLTNLKSLNLNCELIHKSMLTTLMESFSGTLYCPNLTTIITSGISGQQMKSFIAARAIARIPIERIAMTCDRDALDEEIERWLRENVQSFECFSTNSKLCTCGARSYSTYFVFPSLE